MKRVTLLTTDQPLSGSKMASTGQSTTGTKRTTVLKNRLSHFMFLTGVLLIMFLTSGKVSAEDYTITLTGSNLTIGGGTSLTQSTDTKTFTLVAADGYKLPDVGDITVSITDGATIEKGNAGDANKWSYAGDVITLGTSVDLSSGITVTAEGVAKDIATLKTFTYELATGGAQEVTGFTQDVYNEGGYTVSDLNFSKTVQLAGEVTEKSGAEATSPAPVNVIIGKDGTGTATATLTVTAKDGMTAKTYTVNFTFNKAKITDVTAPQDIALDAKASSAEDVIAKLPTTVTVKTENEDITELGIEWAYKGGGFDAANGATNIFTWTATVPNTLNVNGQTVTDDITVTNFAGSSNSKLSTLTYTIGATTAEVSEFNKEDQGGNKSYTVTLDATIAPDATITVNAVAEEAEAGAVVTGTATGQLEENKLVINLTVTPESGSDDNRTVTITFNRTPSDDATLSALTYKVGEGGTYATVPEFEPGKATYSIALPYTTEAEAVVFVTPTPASPYATYAIVQDEPAPTSNEIEPLKVTLVEGAGKLKFKVTAEDEETNQEVTITFTTAPMKITNIEAPVAPVLEEALEAEAVLAEVNKIDKVSVTLENGSTVKMAITWKLKPETEFTKVAGAKNTYTWTIAPSEYEDYELGEMKATGDMEVVNFVEAVTGNQPDKEVVISDSKGLPTQIGDAAGGATTIKSVTVSSKIEQLNVSNTTVIGKVTLNENVTTLALDKATIGEIELASAKSATFVVSSNSEIAQITNAGTLTLDNPAIAPTNLLTTMLIDEPVTGTKSTAPENNGAVKNVANEGTFTDNTATIVTVTGTNALSITSLPTSKSTTGNKIEFTVAATEGNPTYQWQKLVSDNWTDITEATGAKAATLEVVKGASATGAGSYRCKIARSDAATTLYTPAVTATFRNTDNPGTDPTPDTYTVKLAKVTGATFSKGETTTVNEGADFSFTITLDKDYDQSKPVVTVDSKAVEANTDGSYTIKNIRKDTEIVVTGIVKNTATGIEDLTENAIRVWSEGSTLYIYTPEASDTYIVNAAGSLVGKVRVAGSYSTQLRAGIYIVRIGKVSQKVIIR